MQPRRASAEELQRPITDEEVAAVLRDLEPVQVGTGKDIAISAVGRTAEVNVERASIVVGDALVILAEIHAQETLDRIRRTSGASAGASTWAAKALSDLKACAQSRFATRGGGQAVRSTERIVQKHRAALERVLLQTFRSK